MTSSVSPIRINSHARTRTSRGTVPSGPANRPIWNASRKLCFCCSGEFFSSFSVVNATSNDVMSSVDHTMTDPPLSMPDA